MVTETRWWNIGMSVAIGSIFACTAVLMVVVVLSFCDSGKVEHSPRQPGADVSMIEYQGHRFLVFKWNSLHGAGMVHDPECPKCMEPE